MATERRAGRASSRRYSDAQKAQAVRLVRALRAELGTDHGTVRRVADQLGFGVESVRKWVRQADIDDIALRLNTRPRKTLNYNTPAATLAPLLR